MGLPGRNGCGKSTLLRAIFGSIEPKFKTFRINVNVSNIKESMAHLLPLLNYGRRSCRARQAVDR